LPLPTTVNNRVWGDIPGTGSIGVVLHRQQSQRLTPACGQPQIHGGQSCRLRLDIHADAQHGIDSLLRG